MTIPDELPTRLDRDPLDIPDPEPTHLSERPMVFELPAMPWQEAPHEMVVRVHDAFGGQMNQEEAWTFADHLLEGLNGSEEALEAATDVFAAWAAEQLKGVKIIGPIGLPPRLVRMILDKLLPGILLSPVRALLARMGHKFTPSSGS